MSVQKRRRNPYSWQQERLYRFIEHEREESNFYEIYYEKTEQKIPFKILSVMLFIQKDEFTRKPGSLITLYRISLSADVPAGDFMKRYEYFYSALQERGFL